MFNSNNEPACAGATLGAERELGLHLFLCPNARLGCQPLAGKFPFSNITPLLGELAWAKAWHTFAL